jgi:hypothetical protein
VIPYERETLWILVLAHVLVGEQRFALASRIPPSGQAGMLRRNMRWAVPFGRPGLFASLSYSYVFLFVRLGDDPQAEQRLARLVRDVHAQFRPDANGMA